ncbi:MAG: hypothetical protein H7Y28_12725 [Rhodoferax sp.]|nr:hypothetical protein [Rhodoferax sp.]
MTANELIESYVADVAVQLPRKQRNDVAFELRALLAEQLQDKADAAGRTADAAMATDMLRAFGHPQTVAARYLPTLNIIDPADGHRFLRIAAIGLAVIWVLGLLKHLQPQIHSGWDLLSAIGQWWSGVVIPSLWWPGVLVVYFGIAAWTRRRMPQEADWTPLAPDRLQGGRVVMVMGIVGMACGLYVLAEPRWILDVVWSGRAAPAAYTALTYTDTFLNRQAPYLFALIAVNIPMYAIAIAQGRWSAAMRSAETGLTVVMCAVMAWTVMDGPIFLSRGSDKTAKFLMALIIACTLVYMAIQVRRRVRPAPNQQSYS